MSDGSSYHHASAYSPTSIDLPPIGVAYSDSRRSSGLSRSQAGYSSYAPSDFASADDEYVYRFRNPDEKHTSLGSVAEHPPASMYPESTSDAGYDYRYAPHASDNSPYAQRQRQLPSFNTLTAPSAGDGSRNATITDSRHMAVDQLTSSLKDPREERMSLNNILG